MRLVLLGPPGAGKGTLANLIKKRYNVSHVSTGDILREEMKYCTALGEKVRSFMDQGNLVPDEVVTDIIKDRLHNDGGLKNGFMFDGFPRTIQQAEDLDKILAVEDVSLDFVLYLESTPRVIIQRLTGRRVCKKCGALFHIRNKKPHEENVCDYCGGELFQRDDDNEETISNRMEVYLKNIIPLINYYDVQRKVKKLNSDKDPDLLIKELGAYFDEK